MKMLAIDLDFDESMRVPDAILSYLRTPGGTSCWYLKLPLPWWDWELHDYCKYWAFGRKWLCVYRTKDWDYDEYVFWGAFIRVINTRYTARVK